MIIILNNGREPPWSRLHIGLMRLIGLLALFTAAACRSPAVPYVARAGAVMDAVFSVGAWGPDSTRLVSAAEAAFDSMRRVDSLLTGDRSQSEVGSINRAAGRPVPVSGRVIAVLREALAIAAASSGAFDPTGKDYTGVVIDTVQGTVRLRPGLSLDLTGLAPGYALDRAIPALTGSADSAILGIGGVLVVMAGSPSGAGRRVGIADPDNSLRPLARLELAPGTWAIATASITDVDPVKDPRTGQDAAVARSVTTVGRNAITAGAWARAFFVLGCDRALTQAPTLGLGVFCVDDRVRWTSDLNGRVLLTDSAPAAGSAPAPARGPAPGPAPVTNDSRTPPASSGSSH
jgi:thiamine biosynthesis lipoprotein